VEQACALHEVSNALTVVLGWLDVGMNAGSIHDARDAISIAIEHARRGQCLARGSIGAETDVHEPSRSTAALLDFLTLSLIPHARGNAVRLVTQVGSGLEHRPRDASTLTQVLTNLVLNAISFSPTAGEVTVSGARYSEDFVFTVEDDGPGVPESKLGSLFDFGGSGRPGGAGIGLSYSAQLAEERGGRLSYEKHARGARFVLRWPVLGSSSVRPVAGVVPTPSLSGVRLAVLEDDPAVLSLIELALEARGAVTSTAATMTSFKSILAEDGPFDVLLLDLSPLEGGERQGLEEIHQIGRGSPILLVSGRPEGIPAGAEDRVAAWIRKPFDMSQLVEEVRNLVAKAPRVAASGF
jgi:CheY-like chemotaxis protein